MTLLLAILLFFLFSYHPPTGSDTLRSESPEIGLFEKWVRQRGCSFS